MESIPQKNLSKRGGTGLYFTNGTSFEAVKFQIGMECAIMNTTLDEKILKTFALFIDLNLRKIKFILRGI